MTIRVEILGPVRLHVDGDEVVIRRDQVRRALALLASCAGQTVTHDQLVDHLWADRLPTDPRASLRVAMSRLRSDLGDAADGLERSSLGYVLHAETDSANFLAVADQALNAVSADEGLAACQAASAMWSDPVLSLGDSPRLEPLLAQLLATRSALVVHHAELLLRRGDYDEAAVMAKPAFDQDPGNERLAVVVATSLAATGRRGAAIETLDATRRHLRDALGLEPSSALVACEAGILRDSTSLGPAERSTNMAPRSGRDRGPFVGRERERARLDQARGGGLWVIAGEPGSGKSALIEQFEADRETQGHLVVRTYATQTPPKPMEALATLLSSIFHAWSAPSPALHSLLARLVPELVEDHDIAAPTSRESLLAMAAEVVDSFAAETGTLVVVDDAQWLDRSSAQVIDALAQNGVVDIVATTRLVVPPHLEFLLDESRCRELLMLGPLAESEVAQLVALELPFLDHVETTKRLVDQSGGNALFVTLLTELLAEGFQSADGLPPNILLSVQRRFDVLSAQAQRTLEVASVFSGLIPLHVLSALRPTASADAAEALSEGLLIEAPEAGSFLFAHVLVAEAIYQLLSEGTRLDLHDEVGRLLQDDGASAAAYAVHCGAAAALYPARAVTAHSLAAHEFAASFDWDTALLHAERALAVVTDFALTDSSEQASLLVLAGQAAQAQGSTSGHALLLDGVQRALAQADDVLALDGLLSLCTQGRMSTPEGPVIFELVEQMLDADRDVDARAKLLAAQSSLVAISSLQERGRQAYREALALLPEVTSDATRKEVLMRAHLGCPHPADFANRQRAIEQLADLAAEDPDMLWEVAFLRFGSAMVLDDRVEAERQLEQMRALTSRIRIRQRDFGLRFSEAAWERLNGRLDEAEQLVLDAMQIGQKALGDEWSGVAFAAIMTSVREAQGRLHELMPLIEQSLADDPDWPTWHVIAATAAAMAGHKDRARRELAWLKRDNFACLWPDVSWGAMFSFLSTPVALLHDVEAAEQLLDLIEPYAGTNLWNGACTHRSADEVIEILRSVSTGSGTQSST